MRSNSYMNTYMQYVLSVPQSLRKGGRCVIIDKHFNVVFFFLRKHTYSSNKYIKNIIINGMENEEISETFTESGEG